MGNGPILQSTASTQGDGAPRRRTVLRFVLWLLLSVVVSVVIVAGIAAALGWRWFRSSLPETSGTVVVDGVSAQVRIVRDAYGIPTIHAQSERDAFFGLGYAHAQDRFFQMEMQRRTGQGTLSEIAGSSTINTDTYMRKLGLYELAKTDHAKRRASETMQIVDAYAAGVNAWLSTHQRNLPPELGLLRLVGVELSPAPWVGPDSLVWPKVMALMLSGNFESELLRAEVIAKVGEERAEQLFSQYPENGPVTVVAPPVPPVPAEPEVAPPPEPSSAPPAVKQGARSPESPHDAFVALLLEYRQVGLGSNAWVIGPSRSASGRPLLSNDTHLDIQNPSIFYIARLEAPGLSVVGMTLPGVPGVIIGRNERIAWGMTNLGPDSQDAFIEKLAPGDPTKYLAGSESRPFTTRREAIRVAGKKDPVVITVKTTRHGPVMRDDFNGLGPVSLRWPALDPDDTSMDAFLAIGKASNWTEFRAAVAKLVSPGQNFVYADIDGHIGYSASGRIPIRRAGHGRRPASGWDDSSEWTGYVPFEQLPSVLDPQEGFIVSANNKPSAADTPFLGSDWAYERAARIRELIVAKPRHTLDEMAAIRADRKSTLAGELLPALLAAKPKDARDQQALDMVKAWDRVQATDSVGATIFTAWYTHVLGALVKDELGPDLYAKYAANRANVMARALVDPTAYWCDDKTTPAAESCADVATRALHDAVADLTKRLGNDMKTWRLDRLRKVKFVNRVGSMAPLIGPAFTRIVGFGGDTFTVNVSSFAYQKPYNAVASSATIAEAEIAEGGATRMALPLGQSGHPLSPHFADMLPHWQQAKAVPMPTRATTGRELVLSPRGGR